MTVETLSRRMQNLFFSLERVAVRKKGMISWSWDFFKEEFRCTEMLCLCS